MIRPARFLKQISRHMRREKRLSIGSFLVLAIVLVLVDIFWIASMSLTDEYHRMLKTVRMEVFLSETVPDSLLDVIESALTSVDGVTSIHFISKEEAARILETELGPGILEGLEENPLPRSYILSFDRLFRLEELDAMERQIMRLEGVDAVEFGRLWIEKVEYIGKMLRRIGYIVGGVILFVVLLTMANTNRLTARSKSRDFFQLKLLGAGPSYLLYPFLAEGFLSAFIAAAVGWVMLYYLAGQISFTAVTLAVPPIRDIVVYSFLAGFTGVIGAYLGIRRLLAS